MYRISPEKVTLSPSEVNKAFYSKFDLSHELKGCNDMGNLIPIYYEDCIPGDIFKIRSNVVIRFNPMVSPLIHTVKMKLYYFFVPYRLLWDAWEDFITGGQDGQANPVPPFWQYKVNEDKGYNKLWDSFGLPIFNVDLPNNAANCPTDFLRRAYNLVWNEWFRHQDLQNEVPLTNKNLLKKNHDFDYFTSALPFTQRGIIPALPVFGSGYLDFQDFVNNGNPSTFNNYVMALQIGKNNLNQVVQSQWRVSPHWPSAFHGQDIDGSLFNTTQEYELFKSHFKLPPMASSNINELRFAVQLQVWMERNARAGYRYVDFLKAHFPAFPKDDRLQRPEYLGGFFDYVQVTEIQSTVATATDPLGALAGTASAILRPDDYVSYRVQEHGLFLGLLCVYPDHALASQGYPRFLMKKSRYDFYFPEFALLSDQAIWKGEVYADPTQTIEQMKTPFGYIPRYNEYRIRNSYITGLMRNDFSHWHLHRAFTSAPVLGNTFLQVNPSKNFLAVPSEPTFFFGVGNIVEAMRPMPFMATPAGIFSLKDVADQSQISGDNVIGEGRTTELR